MRDIFEELWFIVPRTVKAVSLSFPSYQQSSVNNVQNEDQHSKNRQQVLSPARTGFYNGSLSRVRDPGFSSGHTPSPAILGGLGGQPLRPPRPEK